jgi:ATP-dependent RNA helicase RhlE
MNFLKSKKSSGTGKTFRRSAPSGQRRNKPAQVSNLNPELFIKQAKPLAEVKYVSQRVIQDLPVDARIITNLLAKGYNRPTEIQDRTIEAVLDKKNLLGIAQTGTGKTGAFLIPKIQHLMGVRPENQVLIVVPTRELAVQVQQEFLSMSKGLNMFSHCFIGGTSLGRDLQAVKRPVHFVIGTPGRLTDLSRQGVLQFNRFNTLILDEFDRLLDMGFSRDIQFIVNAMTSRKQTVLFSATEDKSQLNMIHNLLQDAVEVRVSSGKATGDHIDQEIVRVGAGEQKMDILLNMIRDKSFHKVIVFAETKRGVSKVCKSLQASGIRVDEIHGNKSQNYRLKALTDFKSGRIQVLVATDVAARGLDISEVTHVINFQQPRDFDSYIHRIGRTGRAGKGGKAFTFIN